MGPELKPVARRAISPWPVFVLNPVETVATEAESSLRKRDMLVLGTGAGLIMGWVAANVAESARNGRGTRREEDDDEGDV